MNVFVDTSVWSLALRRNPKHLNPTETLIVRELGQLIKEGRVQLLGLIRQELLSGIKSPVQFSKLKHILRAFPDEKLEIADYEAAAESSNTCRTRGIGVSLVDVLICAAAIRRNALVFSTDPDFDYYSRVLPLKLHVPRRFAPDAV
jgi:predicted nucleic acid-binding protein